MMRLTVLALALLPMAAYAQDTTLLSPDRTGRPIPKLPCGDGVG
ncbi:hypothetical protein QTO30_19625 [Yoonia sp. GPGPB17]